MEGGTLEVQRLARTARALLAGAQAAEVLRPGRWAGRWAGVQQSQGEDLNVGALAHLPLATPGMCSRMLRLPAGREAGTELGQLTRASCCRVQKLSEQKPASAGPPLRSWAPRPRAAPSQYGPAGWSLHDGKPTDGRAAPRESRWACALIQRSKLEVRSASSSAWLHPGHRQHWPQTPPAVAGMQRMGHASTGVGGSPRRPASCDGATHPRTPAAATAHRGSEQAIKNKTQVRRSLAQGSSL